MGVYSFVAVSVCLFSTGVSPSRESTIHLMKSQIKSQSGLKFACFACMQPISDYDSLTKVQIWWYIVAGTAVHIHSKQQAPTPTPHMVSQLQLQQRVSQFIVSDFEFVLWYQKFTNCNQMPRPTVTARARARAETDAGPGRARVAGLWNKAKDKRPVPSRPEHIQKTLAVVAVNCILHATWTCCGGWGEA